MTVFAEIRKRDGRVVPFDSKKIADAIFEAVSYTHLDVYKRQT